MEKKRSTDVSKHLLDEAALVFIRHPGQAYSRADIQNVLGVSKPTACRVMTELSRRLALQETAEGNVIYYSLSEENCTRIHQSLDFVLAVSDRERLALSFLLSSAESSDIFGSSINELARKLERAGLIADHISSVRTWTGTPQRIDEKGSSYADTLLYSLETRTPVEIEYKGAFSDAIKTHVLWPVGMYMRDGNLYLYAFSPKHGDATSFAYSRIKGVSLEYDKHYNLPDEVSMDSAIDDPFGVHLADSRIARVRISGKQAFFEMEKKWPAGTSIAECDDGSIVIELYVSDPFAFRTWALSLGKYCLVESPSDLAEWVRTEHQEAAGLYENQK